MTYEPLDNLNGQVAVVVGAAGGIGFATAKKLADSGARVIGIVRRNAEELQKKFDQFENSQLNHQVLLADNTKTSNLEKAVNHLTQCDLLINTAGFSKTIPHQNLDELTDEFFDTMLTVNLRSVFSTIKTFLPLLRQSTCGLIVNISSASALRPGHGSNLAYVAAKAGLESLTKNLALSLAPQIRVVSICPSSMNTGFLNQSEEFYHRAADTTPLTRIAVPEDIALVVEACATKMRFVTGNCFVVDGGRIL
jgi:NAD(P)-dependent dehydrogenase (short-subunit alcohol dehydrogenase family)